ncbi:MAG: response regulator transcription factor [Propionibacteriaceae bacterium]|nr:response regulator transcription factor [Propionibacteriaceae bacterium]
MNNNFATMRGLALALQEQPDFEVEQCTELHDAVVLAISHPFDLVLMDVSLIGKPGVAPKPLQFNQPVVALCQAATTEILALAISAGARGLLHYTDLTAEDLCETLRHFDPRNLLLSATPADWLRKISRYRLTGNSTSALTPRESEMIEALANGKTRAVIAHEFNISKQTVKTHLGRVFEKLQVASAEEAVAKWREINRPPGSRK